jgi:hypothetical protein
VTVLTSRRKFIAQTLAALAALYAWRPKGSRGETLLPGQPHPGLLFTEDDLPRIRRNTGLPFLKKYWESLVNVDIAADTKFLNEELDTHNHVAHLLRANEILKRSAFVALVGQNQQHEQLALLAIRKILSFDKWDYFLEGGAETIGLQRAPETTMAMTFAYDWLYEKLSSAERTEILDAIGAKGAPPCYRTLYGMMYPEKVKGWGFDPTSTYKLRFDLSRWPIILDRTNLKMIPIAGLTIGSVVLYDRHPQAAEWLAMARKSVENFSALFGKDGSYLEGISYWYYTALHLTLVADVLARMQGIDYRKLINFPGTMRYALQMQLPSRNYADDVVNFSDAAASTDASLGFWVAKTFKDRVAQHTAEALGVRRSLFSLIWCDPLINAEPPGEDLVDVMFENEWVVSRSGWKEEDTVVAMRSGGPSNHEHADRNSTIVKAYGERLLHDPYGAAYSHTERHWLLRLTEAHTAVLVDGKGHQYHDGREGTNPSKAEAHVVQYKPGEKMTVFTSDATPAYKLVNSDVRKVQRTVVFLKPDIVLFIDELEKEETPSTFQARFQAFNADGNAKLLRGAGGKSFEIIRPFSKLSATVEGNTEIGIAEGALDVPAEKGIFPYIEVSCALSKRCILLTGCVLSPLPPSGVERIGVVRTTSGYELRFTTPKNTGTLEIRLEEKYPSVRISEM